MKNKYSFPEITNKGQQLLLPFTEVEENYNRLGTISIDDIVSNEPYFGRSPTMPFEYTYVYPNPCERCYNNPMNGGSGFCNCTLGNSVVY